MYLAEEEQREINRLVTEAEARSGAQLLIVIVAKADAYAEIPWKAFAIGSAFAGLILMVAFFLNADLAVQPTLIAGAISATGATLALLAIFVPGFARLFLPRLRAEVEVRQYAQTEFLERQLFATRARVGVLILISLLEREAVIVADTGIRSHVTEEQFAAISAQMKPLLARKSVVPACKTGLGAVTLLLQGRLPRDLAANEIENALIEERGA